MGDADTGARVADHGAFAPKPDGAVTASAERRDQGAPTRQADLATMRMPRKIERIAGPCRMVEPDDPSLARIGDAREVVIVQRVYRRGELVWRGPGVYK